MLHELLLALLGCTGDVFVDGPPMRPRRPEESADSDFAVPRSAADDGADSGGEGGEEDDGDASIIVDPSVTFIEAPEREILNRLVVLGHYFRLLERFVGREQSLISTGHEHGRKGSLYRGALATGIDEVLERYRAAIVDLEQDLLSGAVAPSPSAIAAALIPFSLGFPAMAAVVSDLRRRPVGGGQLLVLLHERARGAGGSEREKLFERLLWHCYQAFYRQLSAWVLYGQLADPYGEFFVARADDGRRAAPRDAAAGPSPAAAAAAATGAGAWGIAVGGDADGGAAEWHDAFYVDVRALPPGVDLAVAESVRFTGCAVRVLTNPRGAYAGRALLPDREVQEAAAAVGELSAAPAFDPAVFGAAIERLRSRAALRLWELVVEEAELPAHLEALRRYFLMGRGDFYSVFFDEAHSLFQMPPRATGVEQALRGPFMQAAAKSTAGESPLFGHVRIRFRSDQAPAPAPPPPPPLRASPAEVSAAAAAWVAANVEMHSKLPSLGDGWDGVTLDYTVEWPLGLLLSPEVIARYATVFQYCFRFRRAQRALEGAWVALRRRRGRERLLALRHRMEHLLACWMHYVQADVIETQAALLQQRLSAVTDFEAAARAHSAFLAALTQQLFLELRVVGKTWEGILQSCVALATAARLDDGSASSPHGSPARAAELDAEFSRHSATLLMVLRGNKLAGSSRAPFLRLFLARLADEDAGAKAPAAGGFDSAQGAGGAAGAWAAGAGHAPPHRPAARAGY